MVGFTCAFDRFAMASRRSRGEFLESYVTKKRDKSAALRFLKKTLKRHSQTEAIVTDGLRSYRVAMRELGNEEGREVGSTPTIGLRTPTFHSDDESGRCRGFGG